MSSNSDAGTKGEREVVKLLCATTNDLRSLDGIFGALPTFVVGLVESQVLTDFIAARRGQYP